MKLWFNKYLLAIYLLHIVKDVGMWSIISSICPIIHPSIRLVIHPSRHGLFTPTGRRKSGIQTRRGEEYVWVKDIFPLGCSDHRLCDHNNFPLCFSANYGHNHSHHTALLLKLELFECCESNHDSPYNDILFFFFN